jgi:hypothetical protein
LMMFLTSVCAQNCLVTMLTKALSPCIAKIIQVWNEFPVQEHWSLDTLGRPQWGRGTCLLWGNRLPNTSPGWNYPGQAPKLLEIRTLPHTAPKTTRVSIEDTGMEYCLGKAKFTSAERCVGALAQQAGGADHRSSFLFLMQ